MIGDSRLPTRTETVISMATLWAIEDREDSQGLNKGIQTKPHTTNAALEYQS